MSKNITTHDIARLAGVSQSTVSRVINRQSGVAYEKRQKILSLMEELHFEQDTLRKKLPVLIAICPLPEQRDIMTLDFFSTQVAAIESTLAAHGIKTLRHMLKPDAETLTRTEINYGVSGIILVNVPSRKLIDHCHGTGIPFLVSTGKMPPYAPLCDTIGPDEETTAWIGCNYLLEHTDRIGFLFARSNATRMNHFLTELGKQNSAPPQPELSRLVRDTTTPAFLEEAYRMIRTGPLPRALVVDNYDSALAIRVAFEFNRIKFMNYLLILTFSHYPQQDQLPSLYQNPRQIGEKSARRMIEKLAAPEDSPHNIRVPMSLRNIVTPKEN